jgi:hypothetical protein
MCALVLDPQPLILAPVLVEEKISGEADDANEQGLCDSPALGEFDSGPPRTWTIFRSEIPRSLAK